MRHFSTSRLIREATKGLSHVGNLQITRKKLKPFPHGAPTRIGIIRKEGTYFGEPCQSAFNRLLKGKTLGPGLYIEYDMGGLLNAYNASYRNAVHVMFCPRSVLYHKDYSLLGLLNLCSHRWVRDKHSYVILPFTVHDEDFIKDLDEV